MSKSYPPMSRWTPSLAFQRTRRRIEDVKVALADIASIWGEIEPGTVDEVEQIAEETGRNLDQLAADLAEHHADQPVGQADVVAGPRGDPWCARRGPGGGHRTGSSAVGCGVVSSTVSRRAASSAGPTVRTR